METSSKKLFKIGSNVLLKPLIVLVVVWILSFIISVIFYIINNWGQNSSSEIFQLIKSLLMSISFIWAWLYILILLPLGLILLIIWIIKKRNEK